MLTPPIERRGSSAGFHPQICRIREVDYETRDMGGSRPSDLYLNLWPCPEPRAVAEWSFNEATGPIAHDSISGTDDPVGGLFKHVPGVSGNGLRFDGESTVITRAHKGVPATTSGVTVDAWVVVDTYPWNWVPIVEHRREEQAGYFFGIDSFGHIGLKVAVGGQWWSLVSRSELPLKKWSHIAGSYDPAKGMAIYMNGKLVGNLPLQGNLIPAEREDLVIGRVCDPVLPAQWIHPKIPVRYSFDGIIDELRIYDRGLTSEEIEKLYAIVHPPSGDALLWPPCLPVHQRSDDSALFTRR